MLRVKREMESSKYEIFMGIRRCKYVNNIVVELDCQTVTIEI